MANKMVKYEYYGQVSCSAFQHSTPWQTLEWLAEQESVMSSEEREEVLVEEEKVFKVEQTWLFYTCNSGRYEQSPQSRRIHFSGFRGKSYLYLAEEATILERDRKRQL